ncbi:PAS domain S-box-containing protein [Pustulibacterium marinum]|uniref:histidine kinase n=1 Tax=Pustulibacterium marinum TaxID=1224947 RepID=A0A1I7EU98_9FLAO|nr:PAS domain-containing sensor histidine kinase [Pustulibacterium marinum]SFU27505.1 PAS domain S-box-containing protein [Pustulibacterium marinum]
MSVSISILERALEREKAARKQAETILEKKSAELYKITQELQESNQKLNHLFNATRSELTGVFANLVDAYLVTDLSGDVIKMNDAAIQLLGFDCTKENFNIKHLIFKEDLAVFYTYFKQIDAENQYKDFNVRVVTKSNELKILHINCSMMHDQDSNEPVAVQGIFRDVTSQVFAEEKLRASENRLALLVNNLDSGVFMLNENNTILLANKKLCDIFNLKVSADELSGKKLKDSGFIFDELFTDKDAVLDRYQEITSKKQVVLGDELQLKNGRFLERNYIPIYENDEFRGHLWSFIDITLKKKFRQSLESEKQKYGNVIANMNLGMVELSNDGQVVMVNQSFCKISGFTEEEIIGKGIGLFTKDASKSFKRILQEKGKRIEGISSSYEIEAFNKIGDKRYWLISGAPNYTIEGKVAGSIGIVLDITEIRNLQFQKEALVEKLERSNIELQEYAHIVSHDLKSPLRSIYALVSWLKEDNEGKLDELSMQNFGMIESTLEKMEQLITDILNYSSAGAGTLEVSSVDLNIVIEDIKQLLYIPNHIQVEVVDKLPVISADHVKIQQVFQNLISNAIKFIDKEEGLVEIGYRQTEKFYEFYVKDNGIGVEEKYHNKVFEIFHSLKKSKDSTGIGLSIVKKIIKLYNGRIWIESTPGEGTTFKFTIKKS